MILPAGFTLPGRTNLDNYVGFHVGFQPVLWLGTLLSPRKLALYQPSLSLRSRFMQLSYLITCIWLLWQLGSCRRLQLDHQVINFLRLSIAYVDNSGSDWISVLPLHRMYICIYILQVTIDNPGYVHHMVIYSCTGRPANPRENFECADMDPDCVVGRRLVVRVGGGPTVGATGRWALILSSAKPFPVVPWVSHPIRVYPRGLASFQVL